MTLLAWVWLSAPHADTRSEIAYIPLDMHCIGQRRRESQPVADVLLDDILSIVLPTAIAMGVVSASPTWTALSAGALIHFWAIPRARRHALALLALGDFDLDEIQGVLRLLNRFNGGVGLAVAVLVVLGPSSVDAHLSSAVPLVGLGVRPKTLRPGALTSPTRNGTVDHFRLRARPTETHWVIEILQPLTLRIPRTDPDLADVVMVLLNCGTDADGKPYLDQGTIGRAFRLSRQMTNERIGLYKSRERIEDVLARSRDNRTLTPALLQAVHGLILEDPFIEGPAIKERLVSQNLVPDAGRIALPSIYRAMQSVDFLDVRKRLRALLRNGDIVTDDRKLVSQLLELMKTWAPIIGEKAGQELIPFRTLLEAPQRAPESLPPSSRAPPAQELDLSLALTPAPPGSPIPVVQRWIFIQYFPWGASYREIGVFLGVAASTVFRRLARLRDRLPPLQKVLGAIRFSGVVDIDEKYILAPKPHRDGKMARWVYLFLAIDPWSYDLLHAEVYPSRTAACARAFLLELKAKGLSPRCLVTDLWAPYETVIPEVFPGAKHHQCVFHAEQAASNLMRDNLGSDYRSIPEARELRSAIIHLFRAGSRRTLVRRYQKLLEQEPRLVKARPELKSAFESVSRHFSKLANAYSSALISVPKTNNAVETVIRCFTRRYKTMAGFDTLESARAYVRLWAYYYRCRPFSRDASPRIRNRSPLQIAGYPAELLACLDLVMPPPQVESAPRAE